MKVEQVVFPVMRAAAKRDWASRLGNRVLKPWNPFNPDRYVDPYPLYEQVRRVGNVTYQKSLQSWNVMGYHEVEQLLRTSTTSVNRTELLSYLTPYSKLQMSTRDLFTSTMLMKDPPDHTRLRSLVSRAFTPRAVASLEPNIEKIARDLLHSFDGEQSTDVMASFADRLPIYVISDMLGLPTADWDAFKRLSDGLIKFADPVTSFSPSEMDETVASFRSMLSTLIEQREREPQDDMLSALLAVEEGGDRLSRAELESLVVLLMVAGHETTSSLIGNALVALDQRSDCKDQLRSEPELGANAIEELLRFDSPVQATDRIATADFELGGHEIKQGQVLGIFLGAANRDPARYERPNELLLDRKDPQSLSFSSGIHYCLGAALARLEAKIAIPLFVDTFPNYSVSRAHIAWKRSTVVRGPARLPVELG